MALITETIKVKWWSNNRKHYEKMGYTFTNYKDEFVVKVDDLSKSSTEKVVVKCDMCGKLETMKYGNYIIREKENKFFCGKCTVRTPSKLSKKDKRLGETKLNKYGTRITVVEYKGEKDITVEFEDGYRCKTRYKVFENGKIRSPYDKSVHGVGFMGEGQYRSTIKSKITPQYSSWTSMLMRVYSEDQLIRHPTYKDVTVCEEWHNFQNFAKWFDDNYYEIEGERMELDKDILIKENRVYSPETCVFVPRTINALFVKNKKIRGDLPIGVKKMNETNRFLSVRKSNGNTTYIGTYDTIEEAFLSYKKSKEDHIKQIADDYKSVIPSNLYEALYNYQVEIND